MPVIRNPLNAIPLKPDNVESKIDDDGCIHLKMTPPLGPFKRKIAKWMRHEYSAKMTLDEYGSFFYSLVDGHKTLSFIVDAMAKKLGKSQKEMAPIVVTFTKSLMTRNMLALLIPDTDIG